MKKQKNMKTWNTWKCGKTWKCVFHMCLIVVNCFIWFPCFVFHVVHVLFIFHMSCQSEISFLELAGGQVTIPSGPNTAFALTQSTAGPNLWAATTPWRPEARHATWRRRVIRKRAKRPSNRSALGPDHPREPCDGGYGCPCRCQLQPPFPNPNRVG